MGKYIVNVYRVILSYAKKLYQKLKTPKHYFLHIKTFSSDGGISAYAFQAIMLLLIANLQLKTGEYKTMCQSITNFEIIHVIYSTWVLHEKPQKA